MEKRVRNKWPALLMFCSLVAGLSAANPLARVVSVDINQLSVKLALEKVATAASFHCSYNPRILPAGKLLKLETRARVVRDLLEEILGEGYSFRENGNYVIIKKQKRPENLLSGYITDQKTGKPLANVTVYDARRLRAVKADSSGYFEISVPRAAPVVITKIGYPQQRIVVSATADSMRRTIRMSPVDFELPAPAPPRPSALVFSQIEHFFNATFDFWHRANVRDTIERRFQLSLLPKVGTNHNLDAEVSNQWSLNVIAGQSKNVRALEVGGLGNFTRGQVRGVQLGGAFNWVSGPVRGVQAGGLFNKNGGAFRGVQLGGLANHAQSSASGLQLGGVYNVAAGKMQGLQAGGIANVSSGKAKGVQIAGITNLAGTVRGVQIAGIFNHSKTVRGVQIGLINRCKKLRGAQFGLINISGRRVLPFFNFRRQRVD